MPLCDAQLHRLLRCFPGPLCAAFGYGSGVMPQAGSVVGSRNMLDIILVLQNNSTAQWHSENLKRNPQHYTYSMRLLGAQRLASLQTLGPVHVFFNTLVPFEERFVKYGVVTRDSLVGDLRDWNALYLAGRLHKPVRWLLPPEDCELRGLLRDNLRAAAAAALLLCSEKQLIDPTALPAVSQIEFLHTLTRLSYEGDPRMGLAEDPLKVEKIVLGQEMELRHLYRPVLADMPSIVIDEDKDELRWKDMGTQSQLVTYLPHDLVQRAGLAPHDNNFSVKLFHSELRRTVFFASTVQTIKSFVTAGLVKGIRYVGRKILKNVKSYLK